MSTTLLADEKKPLNITQIDWCPQICPDKRNAGFLVDIVNEVFQNSPYELEFHTVPWSRAIMRVRAGTADALLSPSKSEAPELLFPKYAIGYQRMCFFTKKSSTWRFEGIESLKGVSIGMATNTSVRELEAYFTQNKAQFHTMPYTKDYVELSTNMLLSGRFDTFIFTLKSAIHQITKLGLQNKVATSGCLEEVPIYMAFAPNKAYSNELIEFFDNRFEYLAGTGRFDAIRSKYQIR
ncbi:MAG: substrate-binding periplasmic protein [Kordiimonas sp.]